MVFAAVVAAPLAACGPAARSARQAPVSAMPADTIEVRAGASVTIGAKRFTLTFNRVEEDSRCPTGVTCVWEGDAIVVLTIARGRQPGTVVRLHTNPSMKKQDARHEGLTIRLVDLLPYPRAGEAIAPEAYRVRIQR